MNESSLTGESSSLMKNKLQCTDEKFIYYENNKSFLFSGTLIDQCSPKEIKALVVGTGFNTQRGHLIQSVLFPKKSNFNFFIENITFFIWSFALFVISMVLFLIINHRKTKDKKRSLSSLVIDIVDLLFIVISPTLPISLTIGTFYYQYSLNQKKIRCCDEYRLISAGRVNKLILDKTGTLTKEELELYGYKIAIKQNGSMGFDSLETDSKLYFSFLVDYYKQQLNRMCKENNNNIVINDEIDNTMTYFLECLALCHSIAEINGKLKGNSIDMKIYENIKWYYKDTSSLNESLYEMRPKKYYQLLDDYLFDKKKHQYKKEERKFNRLSSYSLKVLVRCPFDSSHQSVSVIVKNTFNKTIHFFIKGAPEKIALLCSRESLPYSFQEIQKSYTLRGFRILACATKQLKETEEKIVSDPKIYNLYSAKDLLFLGFIMYSIN